MSSFVIRHVLPLSQPYIRSLSAKNIVYENALRHKRKMLNVYENVYGNGLWYKRKIVVAGRFFFRDIDRINRNVRCPGFPACPVRILFRESSA